MNFAYQEALTRTKMPTSFFVDDDGDDVDDDDELIRLPTQLYKECRPTLEQPGNIVSVFVFTKKSMHMKFKITL